MVCGGGDNMRIALSTTTSLVQYIAIPPGSIPTCILQEETSSSYLSVVYGFMIISPQINVIIDWHTDR